MEPKVILTGAGILLILSGILHVPVWIFDGGSWEGPVSWRKPILFGISTGLTLWSLGWIAGATKQNRFGIVVSFATAAALVVEVGLITLQQWRGTASHFNQANDFDAGIDISMLVLICVAVAGILYISWRCFGPVELDGEYALSARLGLLFLILSCVIGFVISAHGYAQIEAGKSAERYGENGVAKFPHGVAIHVLQILPMLSLLLRKFKVPSVLRRQAIWCVAGSHLLLLAFACIQTTTGKARFDFGSSAAFLLFAAAMVLLAIPVVRILTDAIRSLGFIASRKQTGTPS